MSQIDSGLGWSVDENYYVSSAGTIIETASGTTNKATAGGCIAVAYKSIYNNYGLALISTEAANVGMTVTGDCASYPAVGNDPDSADIGGITWYLRATDSVAGRSSLDYLSDYQYMGNYIVGSGTIAQEMQAILTAANVVYDSSVITDRYVKGYVEGVVKRNNERLKVGDVSSLTTVAKTSTVAAINELTEKTNNLIDVIGSSKRNMYVGSPSFDGYQATTNPGAWSKQSETYNGHDVYMQNQQWNGLFKRIYLPTGTYTFSGMVKSNTTINASMFPMWYGVAGDAIIEEPTYKDNIVVTSEWQRVSFTFTVIAAGYVYCRIEKSDSDSVNDIYISEYKLEKGNVATPYEPYHPQIVESIDNINAYLGLYDDSDIIGCKHDVVNYTHTRMANAVSKNAGSDFNAFPMYGGSYRCNLSSTGVEAARYGDSGYIEDGTNGMCMVFRPKFYYRRVPLKLEPLVTGYGYLMREWIDYISYYPKPGFKLHPAFIGENGQEINGYYISSYEGCLYDVSASAYILDDAQVADFTPETGDILCSIANAKPIGGTSQQLTRANAEILAKNRGTGWHTLTLPILSAEQMLFSIEYATFNSQQAIGRGVVDASAPVITGQTSSLGNASGMASGTDGLVSVSYRGDENPWGNMWQFVEGINIWGDGTMGGGMPYICDDFNFVEEKKTDNYKPAGFTLGNPEGYISAFGYSENCDWLFMPAEIFGSSDAPIGDYYVTINHVGYSLTIMGGYREHSLLAGIYMGTTAYNTDVRDGNISARLVYIPAK